MKSLLSLLTLFCLLASAQIGHAFVPVMIGQYYMRWNVNSNSAHTNVVNRATRKVCYFVASDTYSSANRRNETNAIFACFDQWESVPGSKLGFEFAGFLPPQTDAYLDDRNVIFWAKSNLSIIGGTVNLSGRRGYTSYTYLVNDGSLLDADIILNGAQFQWFTDFNNTTNQALFIESVLLHEIGHFIGLDHTPIGGATVVLGPAGVGTEAGLSADEVAAMRFLYPDTNTTWAAIKGKVTRQGSGVFGAMVVLDDSNGNIASGTVTDSNGDFHLPSLAPGTYQLRVSPFDPDSASLQESLMRGRDIHDYYFSAVTSFLPTTNIPVTVAFAQTKTQNVTVQSGNPPIRIRTVSIPSKLELLSQTRTAVSVPAGDGATWYVGVSSPTIQNGATLSVTGPGIQAGNTIFKANVLPGVNGLLLPIKIAADAPPGLRTLVVKRANDLAYANGYLEIRGPTVDYNFDALDDRFQRQFWSLWTGTNANPNADPDNDLFSNRYEFQTGTNPTNQTSWVFEVDSVRREAAGTLVTFRTDLGRKYQLYSKPAVTPSTPWQPVGNPVTANRSTMTITDSSAPGTRKFYRVAVTR